MPSFYQHAILATAAIFLVLLFGATQYASLMLAFFIANVFPDIDSKNSTVRKNASIIIPALLSFFVVLNLNSDASFALQNCCSFPDGKLALSTRIFAGLIALFASHVTITSLPLSHRGKKSLHSKLFMLLFSALLGTVVWTVFKTPDLWTLIAASMLGYATHMAADKLFNRR